ncbi:hypothetical protein [Priestia megaterium]|uniref:hypothetical protein n=1 Tax=Priestia megaterium TaxID=1404 RepID=UPI001863E1A4|nr:hypothetical protein [Priestia megaterium]MDH3170927.1 hypothetical protein [Priestia megaterium]
MIGGQGEDSCGKNGIGETPAAGAYATRRLTGRPRKAKSCTEINSGVTSSPAHLSNWLIYRLDGFRYVSISFYFDKDAECLTRILPTINNPRG